ncbi:chitin deacetylase [Asbolus verrucosus]|uniref:Chitin deacetylase n=1 Tax=Asbolus verrucosus TaxID=1661398 RepID=A0A482VL38_ASBVE|nr:chitin deacetylase [Asbolus verrucosus]
MKSVLILQLLVALAWGYPSLKNTGICEPTKCKIEEDCRCSSTNNPINNRDDPAPQFVALTVSESLVKTLHYHYLAPLFFNRKNPDGSPVGASFYVNHEYTDYELVQDLYLRGFEIGVHSITKNSSQEYWRHATYKDLVEEFAGQRQIISRFANIPVEEIVGVRTPQLQFEGDLSIDAYVESGLTYDNSWPTRSTQPLLPYTLDYVSNQECTVSITCPKRPHEHFWVAPITNIKGKDNVECNSLATCLIEGTPQEIASWLIGQVDHVRNRNRAPLVLRLDSYWFEFTHNSFEGFTLFLDEMANRDDVFFVSVRDVLDWIKHPVSAKNYKTPIRDRYAECLPINCALKFLDGSIRYMQSCIKCPEQYPWKGNPMGEITK